MSESIGIIRRRSSQTLSTGPPIVASSKYQMLMGELPILAISLLLLLARLINRQDVVFDEKVWKFWLPTVSVGDPAAKRQLPFEFAFSSTAKANSTGASGSLCWTTDSEMIVSLPITRWLLVAYVVDAERRIDGSLEQTSMK